MKVHQTNFNTHKSFFTPTPQGGLFPSELGLSPNSFFFEGYDVSHSFLVLYFIFFVLYFYPESELLGAVLSGCHTPSQLKRP